MAAERILVVDDEPGVRSSLEGILRDEGFQVTTVGSGEEALESVDAQAFDAVLLDIWLPGKDGLETLLELRERRVDLEVVMISGHGTIETAVRATKLGAFDFVEKPLSLEKTLLVLRNALRHRRLERRTRRLLEQLDRDTEILGHSAAAEQVRRAVAAAAASDSPVLISGEAGTGRETLARRIHATGSRADEAFVEIPCAALGAHAAEEALFGGEDGAGRLRLARRGTLFLADVDRLEADVQERLAGRLSALDHDPGDVRPIASVGPAPDAVVPALRRELDVLRLEVPPLRGRREDVGLLAERFMQELAREYGVPQKRLDARCLAALKAHDWPGNVRELRNLVERLLLLAPEDLVRVSDLPEELGGSRGPAEDLYREFRDLGEGLEAFERYYIRRVLTAVKGDRAAAAARLGLEPSALARRLARLDIA